MRFIEEAVELVHATRLDRAVVEAIIARVYGRPAGDVEKEVGQAMLTLELLGEAVGFPSDDAATREFARIRAIPKEEWERRHNAKVAIGIALNATVDRTNPKESR